MEALADLFVYTPFAAIGTLAALTFAITAIITRKLARKPAPVAVIKHHVPCHTCERSRYE